MDLPQVIADLNTAQNKFDSIAYSNCFCETGIMLDKGRAHIGRTKSLNGLLKVIKNIIWL